MNTFLKNVFLSFILLAVESLPVFGQLKNPTLDPKKKLTQYIFESWTNDQGLATNTLLDALQTKSGYLWLASYSGLIRFDGIDFTTFNKNNLKLLHTNSITRLYERRDGTLLVGTEGNDLLQYREGKFSSFIKKSQISYVLSMLEDTRGRLWLGTSGKGLFMEKKGEITRFAENTPLSNVIINEIVEDRDQVIWLGTEGKGLIKYVFDRFTTYGAKHGLPDENILTVYADSKGVLWIGTRSGLCTFDGQRFKTIKELDNIPVTRILKDAHENLWLATRQGIFRKKNGASGFEVFSEKDGLKHNYITDLLLDKEGNLWCTTYRGGLCSFKDGRFINFTQKEGLASKPAISICEYEKGKYLVGAEQGKIDKIVNGEIEDFPLKTAINDRIRHINKDRQGNLLISTYQGLLTIDPKGNERLYTIADGLSSNLVRMTLEDQKGNIWIGTRNGGLMKWRDGKVVALYNQDSALNSDFIMSIEEDREGNILVGTNDGGLNSIPPSGNIIRYYTTDQGLATNLVFSTYKDKEGVIWITTTSGLSRLENDKIFNFTYQEGVPSDALFDIIDDHRGFFWMSSAKGIIQVRKEELNQYAKGGKKLPKWRLYNEQDGMKEAECTGAVKSLRASNGTIWMPTLDGIIKIDPSRMKVKRSNTPVFIREVLVDSKEVDTEARIKLKPGRHRIIFDYRALSLTNPTKIRYKFFLENYDDTWINAGKEKQAVYTNLPPGDYTFRVTVANGDGLWNTKGANISFHVYPYFYQTVWFYIITITTFCLLVFIYIRWRTYSINQRNKVLKRLVDKQTEALQNSNTELTTQKKAIEKAYGDVESLSKIGKRITGILALEQLIQEVYNQVHSLMHVSTFGIGIYHEEENVLRFTGIIEEGSKLPEYMVSLDTQSELSVRCFMQNEDILIYDMQKEMIAYQGYEIALNSKKNPQSLMYIKLIMDHTPIGVVTVQSFIKNAYTEYHLNILKNLTVYIATALKNAKAYEHIHQQKQEIDKKNRAIVSSISYAQRIQALTLPNLDTIKRSLPEMFILYKPRDMVSGDFYWFMDRNYKIIIAAVDATGHGVPGAFMSLIGNDLLTEIVKLQNIYESDQILRELDSKIKTVLKQEISQNRDGMDVALCVIDNYPENIQKSLGKTKQVQFSGASNPLIYIKNGELHQIKGSRTSIGGWHKKEKKSFTKHTVELDEPATFYLYSDGYQDQFGEETRKKFSRQSLRRLLLEIHQKPMEEQREIMDKTITEWQGNDPQTDDILIIGFRL